MAIETFPTEEGEAENTTQNADAADVNMQDADTASANVQDTGVPATNTQRADTQDTAANAQSPNTQSADTQDTSTAVQSPTAQRADTQDTDTSAQSPTAQATNTPTASERLLSAIEPNTLPEVIARYASLPARAQKADFGSLDQNIVVLDTETTGFSFDHDELTQIAAARIEKGAVVDRFVTFVNPGKPISESIVHLTNICDADVEDAPLPDEALAQLVDFIGDAKIVAHNVEFDRAFTTKHPSGRPLLKNVWIDSLDLARIALPRMRSHRLIDLVKAFEAPTSTHRADEDVVATCALIRILFAAVEAMPVPLIRYIAEMATPEQWSTVVVFKHFAENAESDSASRSREEDFNGSEELFPSAKKPSLHELRRARIGQKSSASDSHDRTLHKKASIQANDKTADEQNAQVPDEPPLVFPSKEDISAAFSPSGIVGSLYEDFEARDEQVAMAQAVRTAFATSDNLMVEAGTGVGKSMAYLVPAALTARANKMPVGVATKTNALLDQLVNYELPMLAGALERQETVLHTSGVSGSAPTAAAGNAPATAASTSAPAAAGNTSVAASTNPAEPLFPASHPLEFAALKGFSHYICLRKVERLIADGAKTKTLDRTERSQAAALATILSYIEQTKYDDIDGLKIDHRLIPNQLITTTSNDCLRKKCPYFGESCFVHGAREKAQDADIVVTNHSLLFCDVDAQGGLLPPIRYWIIDEAHGAENEARRVFSCELAAEDLDGLAARVASVEASQNILIRAERSAAAQVEDSVALTMSLIDKTKAVGREFADAEAEFVSYFPELLYFDEAKKRNGYEFVDLWINEEMRATSIFEGLIERGRTMSDRAEKLISAAQDLVAHLADIESMGVSQREVASLALNLKDTVHAIDVILLKPSQFYVYAAHLCRKDEKGYNKLEAMPFDVGGVLNETLYATTNSVVFTSATLTVDGSFDAMKKALGLDRSEQSHCTTCEFGSSYDFDANMKVYVIEDMPDPNDPDYLDKLQKLLIGSHIAQRGSMLTLFTNRREMERCFDVVQPELLERDLRLVCQKWGISTKGLRDDFLSDEHLSLFALKSFWEGFDAPGATLKGVIIPKLPFTKPSDPLSQERVARDDQAWRHYTLPAAVLETKQAAGRLIRKADDKGILVLADSRLVTKGYGKIFLRSLPSNNIYQCTIEEAIWEIEQNS